MLVKGWLTVQLNVELLFSPIFAGTAEKLTVGTETTVTDTWEYTKVPVGIEFVNMHGGDSELGATPVELVELVRQGAVNGPGGNPKGLGNPAGLTAKRV